MKNFFLALLVVSSAMSVPAYAGYASLQLASMEQSAYLINEARRSGEISRRECEQELQELRKIKARAERLPFIDDSRFFVEAQFIIESVQCD